MKKRIKEIILFTIISVFFIFGASVYSYALKIDENNKIAASNIKEKNWLLADDYDGNSNSLYEQFFNREDASKVLEQIYQRLNHLQGLEYYELSNQDLEYTKRYTGDRKLVSGGKDAVNQRIDGKMITPLKSMQVSLNYVTDQKLRKRMLSGYFWRKSDWSLNSDQTIPVIAGSNYQKVFKLNKELDCVFIGTKQIHFKIKGFFKKDTKISLGENSLSVNNYLLIPTMQLSGQDNEEFKKILLSVKCQGYIHYENEDQYSEMVNKIQGIVKETGYQYVIPPTMKYNLYHLSIGTSLLIFFISFAVYVYGVYRIYRMELGDQSGKCSLKKVIKLKLTINLLMMAGIFCTGELLLKQIFQGHKQIFERVQLSILVFFLLAGFYLTLLSVISWRRRTQK